MASQTAIIDGDVLVDCNVFVDADKGLAHRQQDAGGACLVADLVREFAHDLVPQWRIDTPPIDVATPDAHHQAHLIIAPAVDQVWRVERFLGIQKVPRSAPKARSDSTSADLVVLFDANLGFANAADAWPQAIQSDDAPWIVFKTAEPDLSTPLAKYLVDHHADKLVVVVTIEELRRMEVQVSRRLSWERTAQETLQAVHTGPRLQRLAHCGHVIVSFGTSGAVLRSGKKAQLVFDTSRMEQEWEKAAHGTMGGYSSTLLAAIAHQIMKDPAHPSFVDAIQRGVAAMRSLFQHGYGAVTAEHVNLKDLQFPAKQSVKEALSASPALFAVEVGKSDSWTALSAYCPTPRDLYNRAVAVAQLGPEKMLSEVPHLKVGKLFTADRREIESYATVKELIAEYVQRKANNKPFSIAVFGPPGSGKSFGVEQVANAIPGADVVTLTFNLTQFGSPADLHGAFHQIRDVSLSGKLPLVFWDEFDTNQGGDELGWPRHFLAPMQDGKFQSGPLTHPIGRSIFVFAGGTAKSWKEFHEKYPPDHGKWKPMKLKDFLSRLRGHLDVLGPDPVDDDDRVYVLRRAILLRSMLRRDCPWLFVTDDRGEVLQIDREVLCAFLRAPKYVHGARSMEAIIAMSGLARKKFYYTSSLPPDSQLAMHVSLPFKCPQDAVSREFEDDVAVIERLAEMAHDVFRDTRTRYGWTYGAARDDSRRVHNLLVPYSKLPRAAKASNRESVRKIPKKLAAIGYEVRPARPGEIPPELTPEEVEKLAPLEHDIWMENKRREGFTLGQPTAAEPRKSPYLKEWNELTEEFKDTDRAMVRAIPAMLAQAGYTFERKSGD